MAEAMELRGQMRSPTPAEGAFGNEGKTAAELILPHECATSTE